MSKDEVKGLFTEAAKITIVAFVSFFVADWLKATFKGIPEWLLFAIPSFLVALLVCFVWLKATSKAHVSVLFHDTVDPSVERTQLVARFDGGPGSPTYGRADRDCWITVRHDRSTGLGLLALRFAVSRGLRIQIALPHSDIIITPKIIHGDPALDSATPGNVGYIDLALQPPLALEGRTWARVLVELIGGAKGPQNDWTIEARVVGSTRMAQVCGNLVRVDVKAASLVETWS